MSIFCNFYSKYDRLLDIMTKLFISYCCINIYIFVRENNYRSIEYIQKKDNSTQTYNYSEEDGNNYKNIKYIKTQSNSTQTCDYSEKEENSCSEDDDMSEVPFSSFLNVGQYLYDSQENL